MYKYRLFYAGYDRDNDIEQIGVGLSQDLSNWILSKKNPIVPLGFSGSGDLKQTSNPCVLKKDGVYKMWYQGKSSHNKLGVFYAESKDAESWDGKEFPVLEYSENSDLNEYRLGYQHPHVLFDENKNKYFMWCSLTINSKTSIYFAESIDGISWQVKNESVLSPEYVWEGDHVIYPMVLKEEGIYKMWYAGKSKNGMWSIGFAESYDGLVWKKQQDPIIHSFNTPKILRRSFEFICKIVGKEFEIPLSGIASVNVWKEDGKYKLLAHEVGTHGRLYIPIYESTNGIKWKKTKNNIFKGIVFSKWDRFFQGDPYLYVE